MPSSNIFLIPLSVCILMPTTFILTYIIAVCLHHIEADFPYISDTGTYRPESCIFGQLLNISAFLLELTLYIRYKMVQEYGTQHVTPHTRCVHQVNTLSFVIGSAGAFGLSIVANFQETSLERVHITGALLAFSMGVIYLKLQTFLSYKMAPIVNSRHTAHVRLVLAIIATVSFIMSTIFSHYSIAKFHGKDKTKWYPKDGGWKLHIVATAAEWTLAIAFCCFILSFVSEFRKIRVTVLRVHLHEDQLAFNQSDSLQSESINDSTSYLQHV